jgi:hypothetical protein
MAFGLWSEITVFREINNPFSLQGFTLSPRVMPHEQTRGEVKHLYLETPMSEKKGYTVNPNDTESALSIAGE